MMKKIGFKTLPFAIALICSQAHSAEVSVGMAFHRSEHISAAPTIEVSTSGAWKLGIGYVGTQTFDTPYKEGHLACSSLGAFGEICEEVITNEIFEVKSYVYGVAQYRHVFRKDTSFRPYLGLGAAVHPKRTPLFNSNFTFALTMGAYYNNWSLTYNHRSTADLWEPNIGQDSLNIGFSF